MTDTINEQLSAFMDGELPVAEHELLRRRLVADASLVASWRNYHLIRDAMRGVLPEFVGKTSAMGPALAANQAAAQAAIKDPPPPSRPARPPAGWAVAASLAALIAAGALYYDGRINTASPRQIAYTTVPKSGWQSAGPAAVSALNGYLVDHSHYAGIGSVQGIMPYSRVVGYDSLTANTLARPPFDGHRF